MTWSALKERLPLSLRYLASRLLPMRSRRLSPNVSDLRTHDIADGVVLDVYWLASEGRQGPAASLYVHDDEVLRLDCLDGSAHLHFNRRQCRAIPGTGSARQYFPPGPVAAHIERACFELGTNLPYFLALNVSRRIRDTQITPAALADAAATLRREMQALNDAHASAGADAMRQSA